MLSTQQRLLWLRVGNSIPQKSLPEYLVSVCTEPSIFDRAVSSP